MKRTIDGFTNPEICRLLSYKQLCIFNTARISYLPYKCMKTVIDSF